jgi:hypothetical protein
MLTYVEVDDLGEQSDDDEHQKNVEKPLLELAAVLSRGLGDDSSTETLGCNDTQSSDQTADGDVHHHRLLTVLGTEPECNDNTCNDDDACIAEKAGRNDPLLHVLDARNRRLFGCIYCDNNRADDAIETSNFSDKTQALLQENGGQYGADYDR